MANIPGSNPLTTPPPPIPGAPGTPQPTPEQKAAIEAKWAEMRDAPLVLAEVIIIINDHPELLEWARQSVLKKVGLPH